MTHIWGVGPWHINWMDHLGPSSNGTTKPKKQQFVSFPLEYSNPMRGFVISDVWGFGFRISTHLIRTFAVLQVASSRRSIAFALIQGDGSPVQWACDANNWFSPLVFFRRRGCPSFWRYLNDTWEIEECLRFSFWVPDPF